MDPDVHTYTHTCIQTLELSPHNYIPGRTWKVGKATSAVIGYIVPLTVSPLKFLLPLLADMLILFKRL